MRGIIGDMCGRYGFSVKNAKDVYERFDTFNELSDYQMRFKLCPKSSGGAFGHGCRVER